MMKSVVVSIAGVLLSSIAVQPWTIHAAPPVVRFAIAVHSEEPGGPVTANTPNFTTVDKLTYDSWRQAILWFAEECRARSLDWDFQSDWNFLEGVRRFETPTGADYDPALLSNGKNTVKFFQEDRGVELDPHSHESAAYNYADVAWLIDVGCDATPSGVVGGHVYSPDATSYQNWPKFVADADGLNAVVFTNSWRPHLLMGAASPSHVDDPHAAGLWRPAGTNNFFVDDPGGSIAAIATWEQDLAETDGLLTELEDGTIDAGNHVWTCGMVFNHRDMLTDEGRNIIRAQLETIRRWRDAGRFAVANFETIYQTWTNAPFNGESSLYLRPDDNLGFSLNWQDFFYPDDSASELRQLLDVHEALRVPVEVFLTTWQEDILETNAPDVLGRLQSSAWVNMGYHVRAPKPYANEFAWTNSTADTIADYESHGLDLTNGIPTSSVGGFEKITALAGHAPIIVGANADISVSSMVHTYFRNAGAGMLVEHRSVAVNLGDERDNLPLRPEHFDWRLIETYEGMTSVTNLDQAFDAAHASTGGNAPWFVGVKLHDNDIFADQSAWTWVYHATNRTKLHWTDRPWDLSSPTPKLASEVRAQRRAFYTNLVAAAAARRGTINLVDSRNTLSLLAEERPREVALSVTSIPETTNANVEVARISGGGILSGVACDYELVAGDGDTDNADFSLDGNRLLATAPLDFETKPVRHFRLRWTDGGDHSGERAMTLVLANILTDDDDSDGMNEADELAAGTDPLDAASVLRAMINPSEPGQSVLTVNTVAGHSYDIESTTDFGTWTPLPGSPFAATGPMLEQFIDRAAATQQFFRVRLATP